MQPNRVANTFEIPRINAVCHSRPIDLRLKGQNCCTVIDSCEVPVQTSAGVISATIMSLNVNQKMVGIPGSDVLFYFVPTLGGTPSLHAIHPSVLFWRDKFWTTFVSVEPSLQEIAEAVGLKDAFFLEAGKSITNVDLIYQVQVMNIPELDWGSFDAI